MVKYIGYVALGVIVLRLIALVLQPVGDTACSFFFLLKTCSAEPSGWFWSAFMGFVTLTVVAMMCLVAWLVGNAVNQEIEDWISAFKIRRKHKK